MDAFDINVGGLIHTTSLNTLTKFKDSLLSQIVNGELPCGKDQNSMFNYIFKFKLNFLIKTTKVFLHYINISGLIIIIVV